MRGGDHLKHWTTKEIQYLKKNALFAETNVVLNVEQLAKKLGRSLKSVDVKIYKLRQDGQFPPTDFSKSFDPRGRKFTESEDKRIIAMYRQQETYKAIGESLDRTEQAIAGRIMRLKKIGKLKQGNHKKHWTQKEVEILLANIQFDKNGFCCNHAELARLCNRTVEQVTAKMIRLRKAGLIETTADRGKTSVKSKQAMNQFNEARFAHVPKKKEECVMASNSPISVESREVTLILTTTVINGQRSDQYFTKDGQLIAKKELTSVAPEVSSK